MQGEDRYAIRTSINERGEQTINRGAKTCGGIKSFVSNEKSVLKWCFNGSEQASNSRALLELCGVEVVNDQCKPCRPSQIILSENVINEYLNPFGDSVDPNDIFNLFRPFSITTL